MPYAAPRPCRHRGCPELVTGKVGFCEQHRKAEHRRYNREQRPKHHKLYGGSRWRALRDAFITEHPFCEKCGRLAELVHHRVEHKGDVALFYSEANLSSLCTVCHNQEHRRGAVT